MPLYPGRFSLAFALASLLAAAGCAHSGSRSPGLSDLKSTAERYHRLLRWGDVRASLQIVAPELRAKALRSSVERKDDEDLKVIDYEMVDAQVDGERAKVLSKITWHRLPSVTARTDAVSFELVARDGAWYIRSIDGGPVPLAAPSPAPAPSGP